MPFFVVPLFIGMAAAAGTAGVGMAAKGSLDQHTANQLNDNSGARIRWAANNLEKLRGQCSDSLNALGKEKVIAGRRCGRGSQRCIGCVWCI